MTTIILAVVACVLGFIVIAFIMRTQFDQKALQWRELSNASIAANVSGDVDALKQVAANNPDTTAGYWAMLLAGDQQLRMGLGELATDRDAGFAMIRKAKETLQSLVDAPEPGKTTMIKHRSEFALAYACESLGEFEEAKKLYEEFVEAAPESALAESAQRGIGRCSNKDYAELYVKFQNYEAQVIGDAPGPPIPDRPRIGDFPEVDLPPGQKPPAGDNSFPTTPAGEETTADPKASTPPAKETDDGTGTAPEAAAGKGAATDKQPADDATKSSENPGAENPGAEKTGAEKAAGDDNSEAKKLDPVTPSTEENKTNPKPSTPPKSDGDNN